MTRSIFLFLLLPLIIQRVSGSSCEAGHDQSDQGDSDGGGGEWKVSLMKMEEKVDQAVAGVNREVGCAMSHIQLLSYWIPLKV